MSYGLEAIKTKGDNFILDQNSRALRVASYGSVARTTVAHPHGGGVVTGTPANCYLYKIPIPAAYTDTPIIMIDWEVGDAYFSTGRHGNFYHVYDPFKTGPASLSWRICDFEPPTNTLSGYGMAIFDASGDVVYSSAEQYVRVKEVLIEGPDVFGTNPITHTNMGNSGWFTPPFLIYTGDFGDGFKIGSVKRTSVTQLTRVDNYTIQFQAIVNGNPAMMLGS